MLIHFLKYTIMLGVLCPLHASGGSEWSLNGKPLLEWIPKGVMGMHNITMQPENGENGAFITVKKGNIEVKWGKATIDYNTIGSEKNSKIVDSIGSKDIQFKELNNNGGLIGDPKLPVDLKVDKATFNQTSLDFAFTFSIASFSPSSSPFSSLLLTKSFGTNYPLIDGVIDFTDPMNALKPYKEEKGFVVMGCDISFVVNTFILKKSHALKNGQ